MEETKKITFFQSTKRTYDSNTSPPKLAAPNFIKQTLLGIKSQTNPNIVTVVTSRSTFTNGQTLIRETVELNGIIGQMNLIDIYRAFYPNTAEYTFFLVSMPQKFL